MKITCNLTAPYLTDLQLSTRTPEKWELDEPVKRILSQLNG